METNPEDQSVIETSAVTEEGSTVIQPETVAATASLGKLHARQKAR